MSFIDNLFDDVGATIKKIAKYSFYALLIGAAIMFIVGLVKMFSALDHYDPIEIMSLTQYDCLLSGYSDTVNGYMGKQMCKAAIIVVLCDLVGPILVYGFGELIEKVTAIEKKLKKENFYANETSENQEKKDAKIGVAVGYWTCKSCGKKNANYVGTCSCGSARE